MTLTLEAPSMPPERRRPRLQLRQAAQQQRTHATQARQYAELWYQALLAWEVEHGSVPVPRNNYTDFRNRMHGGISTLGEFLPAQATMLILPSGEYLEGEVSQMIKAMQRSSTFETSENGHLLDALRDPTQRKPTSLLREGDRWERDAPRMAAWALAVLSLAVALRDEHAGQYLAYCRRVMDRGCISLSWDTVV